jgi:ribosome maturation factor RimP
VARSATGEDLRRILEPVITSAGLDLEAVEVTPAGKRRILRVIIDQDGGVDLDAVADTSRRISQVLDAADVLGDLSYVLEVTSPGIDRPLTEQRHWRRAIGRLVETRVGGEPLTGRVMGTSDTGVEFRVSGVPQAVPWRDLAPGRVQIEFSRVSAPGAPENAGEEG